MYAVVIEYDPQNGSYGATSPDFDYNVVGIGKSSDEALRRFGNALEAHVAALREDGKPLPEPHFAVTSVAAPVEVPISS
jgi:predicted RNase H-like HicB family nuclease